MKLILSTILFAFLAMTAMALTPEEVREQYPLRVQGVCTDRVSGEQGRCYVFDTGEGVYMVFVQNGRPVFMRYVENGSQSFEEVWRAAQGVAL